MSTESDIIIGDHVMFGPNVTIIGGNHNMSVVGAFMRSVRHKNSDDDEPVIIDDDVWIGANVTLLKGVKIGRGSIVAADSVVTRSFPQYAVIGSAPAHLIRWRWPPDIVVEHEAALYPPEKKNRIETIRNERERFSSKDEQVG